MKGIAGIIAGALCALVIACGAAQKTASAPPPSMAPAEMGRGSPQHDEIERYERQINEARDKMGLGPPPIPGTAPVPAEAGPTECHRAQTPTCNDSCTFADSICDNAGKICEIAKRLPGDAWATDKCNAARATCKEAKDRCCGCQ